MRQFLSVLALTLFLSSAALASFPVKSSNANETTAPASKQSEVSKEADKAPVKTNKVEKVQGKSEKKAAKGSDSTVAIILAVISVLLLPFGLHNWYLGRKKQALWQTLLVIPGFILLLPPLISWIWQIVDLIRLLINGELPS